MSEAILPVRALASFSDQGKRALQEDFQLAARDKGVFVVADGFGGPEGGVRAAKTACEAVQRFLIKEGGDREATLPFVLRSYYSLAGNVLFNAIIHANLQVNLGNKDRSIHEKGGASVIAGFLDGDLLALANVGACSAWMVRGGKAAELVLPRSYARIVDPISPSRSPEYQVPLSALGMSEDLEPEIFEVKVHPGDWVVLMTDGLLRAELFHRFGRLQVDIQGAENQAREAARLLAEVSFEDNATGQVLIF